MRISPSRSTLNSFVRRCLPSSVYGMAVHALSHVAPKRLQSSHADETLNICESACYEGEATGVRLCPEVLLIKMECI
jgi:hypothetical protein